MLFAKKSRFSAVLDEALGQLAPFDRAHGGDVYNAVLRIERNEKGGRRWVCKLDKMTAVNGRMKDEFVFWEEPYYYGWPMDMVVIDGASFKSRDLASAMANESGTRVMLDTRSAYGQIAPWTPTQGGFEGLGARV